MFRKITRTGPATLTIAIPAKWAKNKKLKPGDEINVEEVDGNLIISAENVKKEEQIRIPYNKALLEEMLKKLYFENTPNITIYSDDEIPKEAKIIIDKFPGLKIIEENSNKWMINQTLKAEIKNPKSILRRAFILIKEGLEHNPPEFSKDIPELIFLAQINSSEKNITIRLNEIFLSMSTMKKPVFDEVHGTLRLLFELIYAQKYKYGASETKKITEILEKTDELFIKYSKKTDSLELAKSYYCFKTMENLHKNIILEQSLETLSNITKNTSKKKYSVGVCLKNYSNPFWRDEVRGGVLIAASFQKNAEYDIRAPLDYPDLKEQEKIIDEFIKKGVDAIILAPLHPSKLKKHIQKINKLCIPLIIIDTDLEIEGAKYKYIGWDNYKAGYMTGEFINKKLKNKSNILVVEGHPEGNWRKRALGFIDAVKKRHKTDLIQGEFQQSIAYDKTLNYMKKHKADAIFATSDNMALGVIQALKYLKLKIPVCGFDKTREGTEALKKKELISTIDTKPKHMGALAGETAYNLLSGKAVADKIEYDVELITS